jgi:hypothetical protein
MTCALQGVLSDYLSLTPVDRPFYLHTDRESLAALWAAAGQAVADAERDADADADADQALQEAAEAEDSQIQTSRSFVIPAVATRDPALGNSASTAAAAAAPLDITQPPADLRPALLAAAVEPRNVGCGHMRQFLLRPA